MIDFKKEQKDLYQAKITPVIVDVPKMTFIAVNGKGDPNGEEFASAIQLLYSLSYSIKMNNKMILEYVVPPLEGIWWKGSCGTTDKSKFEWVVMLHQPDFVTKVIFEKTKEAVNRKKGIDVSPARLETFKEGLCTQILHIGSYDDESSTIEKLEEFVKYSCFVFDITDDSIKSLSRRHHEIYLSNPGKVAAEKLKTIIRYPVKKK